MFANRIKDRRLQLNMTQEELANKVGYKTKGAISRIEKGERDISQTQISDFAKALNTTESYLMGWTDNPNINKSDLIEEKLSTQTFSLSKDQQDLLDNYNNSNRDGKAIILDTSKNVVKAFRKPSRQEMIDYLREIKRAAFRRSRNVFDMTDNELEELYFRYKEDSEDD